MNDIFDMEEEKVDINKYCDNEEVFSMNDLAELQSFKEQMVADEEEKDDEVTSESDTFEKLINEYLSTDDTTFREDTEEIDIIIPNKKEKKQVVVFDKDNLNSFQKMLIKNHKGYYKAGKVKSEGKKHKKSKNKNKKREMTEDELANYYNKKQLEKERKYQLKFMKEYKKETSKSKNKKYSKLEREIEKEYFKQKEEEKPKTIDELLIKRKMQKWKDRIGYDFIVKKKHYDPYHNYRRAGNIISISELEDFKEDYKVSFLKNIEQAVMEKLQEPIDYKVKTRVEYYDKKGNLISEEILPTGKKKKKKKDKFSKKELSPDFDRF